MPTRQIEPDYQRSISPYFTQDDTERNQKLKAANTAVIINKQKSSGISSPVEGKNKIQTPSDRPQNAYPGLKSINNSITSHSPIPQAKEISPYQDAHSISKDVQKQPNVASDASKQYQAAVKDPVNLTEQKVYGEPEYMLREQGFSNPSKNGYVINVYEFNSAKQQSSMVSSMVTDKSLDQSPMSTNFLAAPPRNLSDMEETPKI